MLRVSLLDPFSFCLDMDAHGSHSSSISTRASVVTFWLEAYRSVGLGEGLLLEQSAAAGAAAALCLQGRFSVEEAVHTLLNMVKKHPQTMHMGDGAGQLQITVDLKVIFIS